MNLRKNQKTIRKLLSVAGIASIALVIQGCAHSALERGVDEKLTQETAVKNRSDLREEAGVLIQKDSALSTEQKTKLTNLRESVRKQMDEMSDASLRLRSILVKDLLTTNYNEDEVELIKDRLSVLEDKRLKVQFGAVEEANKILGRQAQSHQWISHDFFDQPGNQTR